MESISFKPYLIICLIFLSAAGCSKEHFNYEHFIENGPIQYPGRADTVQALAGNGRILLKWAVPSDQNITEYKIFWNFGTDSLSVQGRTPTGSDSVRTYIEGLSEGAYGFTVYSYDKQGHKSVGSGTSGNVYGGVFASTIFNRSIRSLKRDTAASVLYVAWVGIDAKCLGTEWYYTDLNGGAVSMFSPVGDSTIIPSCDVSQPVSYRSMFLPESKAIDTFYTDIKPL